MKFVTIEYITKDGTIHGCPSAVPENLAREVCAALASRPDVVSVVMVTV